MTDDDVAAVLINVTNLTSLQKPDMNNASQSKAEEIPAIVSAEEASGRKQSLRGKGTRATLSRQTVATSTESCQTTVTVMREVEHGRPRLERIYPEDCLPRVTGPEDALSGIDRLLCYSPASKVE